MQLVTSAQGALVLCALNSAWSRYDRSGSVSAPARYFNDGIHPSLEGYAAWRDQLLPFLEQVRAGKR